MDRGFLGLGVWEELPVLKYLWSVFFFFEGTSLISPVLLALTLLLIAAKIGGDGFERIRQPAVLGELLFGVVLGNLSLLGWNGFDFIKHSEVISSLAEIGVILLLFEVGLESNLFEMLEVGWSSFLVALLGVIAPMLLGWGLAAWFLPHAGGLVHLFIGSILAATSVGLTARVLQDLGKSQTREARIILGAAVIDDVMGLLVLAAVSGMIAAAAHGQSSLSWTGMSLIMVKAVAFLMLSVLIGQRFTPWLFARATHLRGRGVLVSFGLAFCFFTAWLASLAGLAPIVGAFAAGLVLDRVHYYDLSLREDATLEKLLNPLTSFLVPVFFVLMGLKVELKSLFQEGTLYFALLLTLVAVLGKQCCSLGVLEKGTNRLAVGIGMIPRGEVGLICASYGSTLVLNGQPVVSPTVYSAVVLMIVLTTLVTPPLLKLALSRQSQQTELKEKFGMVSASPTDHDGFRHE
jgi:Kef-type K+ transport system membrane component KefB